MHKKLAIAFSLLLINTACSGDLTKVAGGSGGDAAGDLNAVAPDVRSVETTPPPAPAKFLETPIAQITKITLERLGAFPPPVPTTRKSEIFFDHEQSVAMLIVRLSVGEKKRDCATAITGDAFTRLERGMAEAILQRDPSTNFGVDAGDVFLTVEDVTLNGKEYRLAGGDHSHEGMVVFGQALLQQIGELDAKLDCRLQ